jgi:hypothetical protein
MSGKRPVVKIIAESLSQHDEKHVVQKHAHLVGFSRLLRHPWKKERGAIFLFWTPHDTLQI